MKFIKSIIFNFRNLRLAASLAMGLCISSVAFGADLIQSIDVSPNPLITGRTFTIAVTASPDVTEATATVAFRPGEPRPLQIQLTKQGNVLTGSGTVPTDIQRELPSDAGALVRVTVFDAAGRQAQGVVRLGVRIETITAVFADGILTITGDDLDNTITVSRDLAGRILVNAGAIPVTGGTATVGNTSLVRVIAQEGNDTVRFDEANGVLPTANLLGGDGNDTLSGGAGDDQIEGGPGDDSLFGKGGIDRLLGGRDNDFLSGGVGNDQLFGGDDDDVIDWLPGDGSDLVEGEDGNDELLFVGGNGSEDMTISANGPRLRFFRNPGLVTMDCDGIEKVSVQAKGGADVITVNDLTDTKVRNVALDIFGSGANDVGAKDSVVVEGTEAGDTIKVAGSTNEVSITRLDSVVTVVGAEQDTDSVTVNSLGGDDIVDAGEGRRHAIWSRGRRYPHRRLRRRRLRLPARRRRRRNHRPVRRTRRGRAGPRGRHRAGRCSGHAPQYRRPPAHLRRRLDPRLRLLCFAPYGHRAGAVRPRAALDTRGHRAACHRPGACHLA